MKRSTIAVLLTSLACSGVILADDAEDLRKLCALRDQISETISDLESHSPNHENTSGARTTRPEPQNVMLRTREGYYLRAKLGGGHNVTADVRHPKTSEVFVMEWITPTALRLRTRNGHYVGARRGGGHNVDATVKQPRTSEVFTVEWQDSARKQLRLRTRDGFYIHPIGGGGSDVDARITAPKTSEVLTLIAAP